MSIPTTHIPWCSIELLHNLVKTLRHLHALGEPLPRVDYRAKVKLHGTNCALQLSGEGVFAQSRTALLSPQADYKGFAAWAQAHEGYFSALPPGLVIYGEWCGPGVEKGMAISQLPGKIFAVFAVRGEDSTVVSEPDQIRALLPLAGAPEALHVLPWEGAAFTLAFDDEASLEQVALDLNERVVAIEHEDPWVKRQFGLSGLGEGLVFYPIRVDGNPVAAGRIELLMFKAKGEKHRTAGTRSATQVNTSIVASVEEFVCFMVTEARLQQGLTEACGGSPEPRAMAAFLAWVGTDVRKESTAELEAAGLSWGEVEKAVQARARNWLLTQARATATGAVHGR